VGARRLRHHGGCGDGGGRGRINLGVDVEMGIGLGFEESLPDRSLVPSPHPFTSLFLFHFSFFFKEISLFISQL